MDHFVEKDQRIQGYLYQMFEAWWSNNGIRYTSQITHRTRGIGFQIWFSIKCCQMVPVWGFKAHQGTSLCCLKRSRSWSKRWESWVTGWTHPTTNCQRCSLEKGRCAAPSPWVLRTDWAGDDVENRCSASRWDPTCLNLERKRKDARWPDAPAVSSFLVLICSYAKLLKIL